MDYFEPVGELQTQEQDEAAQHQRRGLNLAFPRPLEQNGPSQTDSNDNIAGYSQDESVLVGGAVTSGLKRKRASFGNEPAGPAIQTSTSEDGSVEAITPPLGGDPRPVRRSRMDAGDSSASDAPAQNPDTATDIANKEEAARVFAGRPNEPLLLPPRKVFPIQIGSKLFRLSGVSLSSDAPSYFTQFFEHQLQNGTDVDSVRTLYIDRDPDTFRDISLHLQGYHIEPRDGTHFVRLFADAVLFNLSRLIQQLHKSTIFIRVGDEEFKIPRDLFSSPGDTPNYFSLGFSIFFTHPATVLPAMSQSALLRPPAILPPHVPNRSARVFKDLLDALKGYDVHIRNEEHRNELLRDARYYHFKGLEQRLIPHHLAYNPHRSRKEITLRLDDMRMGGISYRATKAQNGDEWDGAVTYARPHADMEHHDVLIEIGPDTIGLKCSIDSPTNNIIPMGAEVRSKFHSLYKAVCHKVEKNLASSTDSSKVELAQAGINATIDRTAHVVIDGRTLDWSCVDEGGHNDLTQLWLASLSETPDEDELKGRTTECWMVHKSIWRIGLTVQRGTKPLLNVDWQAVKIDAATSETAGNRRRQFLGAQEECSDVQAMEKLI